MKYFLSKKQREAFFPPSYLDWWFHSLIQIFQPKTQTSEIISFLHSLIGPCLQPVVYLLDICLQLSYFILYWRQDLLLLVRLALQLGSHAVVSDCWITATRHLWLLITLKSVTSLFLILAPHLWHVSNHLFFHLNLPCCALAPLNLSPILLLRASL